jgi:tetratricopeptide (TPR) repeat protein
MEEKTGPTSVADYAAQAKRYEQAGDVQAAMRSYLIATHLQMLLLNPNDAAACFQLGMAFGQAGREDHAQAAFRAALVLQPAHAEACNNLGVLSDRAEPLRRAVRLAPQRADYHTNLAHVLLTAGQWAEGFRQWEWRTPSPKRDFAQPRWDGSPFAGKTVLIHAEQGFGDCIQFCRYLPAAAALGGTLIVEMRPPLAGLMSRFEGVSAVVPWGETLPPFDFHLPLPSLANLFQDTATPSPYLAADPARIALWQERITAPGRKKVGLVWAVNPQAHDQRRAIPFTAIAELVKSRPDIAFFGLQREGQESCEGITGLGPDITDFDDLAGALASLDLLISVDTAAAHLAGALGYEAWVLLRHSPDWRWRGSWYPRTRLYRQANEGNWSDVLERVKDDLDRL